MSHNKQLAPESTGVATPFSLPVHEEEARALIIAGENRSRAGIVVFSISCGKVLFFNEAASCYLNVHGEDDFLRPAIMELVNHITAKVATDSPEHAQLEARRLVTRPGSAILVQAFGIPQRGGSPLSRVVVVMRWVASAVCLHSPQTVPSSSS